MALADIIPPAPTLCSNARSHLTVGKGEEEEQTKVCNSDFVRHGTREGVNWRKENTHKKTQIQILAIYVMTDMQLSFLLLLLLLFVLSCNNILGNVGLFFQYFFTRFQIPSR